MNSIALAKKIRIESLKMVNRISGSHIGSALSMTDILAVLYTDILKFDPLNPNLESRDRLILSKGHACSSLYACLALKDFFSIEDLKSYGKDSSDLMNHVSHKVPGVEFSTGSLGHGLPFGVGKANSLKIKRNISQVHVIMGDGELSEGSNFEAMLFAAHHNLDNLNLIIDYNNLQSLTTVKETLNILPIKEKFISFGWEYYECDGHNHSKLKLTMNKSYNSRNGKPKIIVANTIKGKGVSYMENKVEWHYRSPDDSLLREAINEIENAK